MKNDSNYQSCKLRHICKFIQYLTATKPMSKLLPKLLCENEINDSYINIPLHMDQVCYA